MSSFLKTNCRGDTADLICDIGNLAAIFANLIGYTYILPQIYQIWNYKSVEAVHALWPTALFTASLANTFYVFATETRVFFKISSVYYPIVYLIFLSEFWFYTKKSAQKKLSYGAICVIVWACLLTIELTVSLTKDSRKLEWIVVIVFSINLVPQIMLNIMMRTTCGQSTISVLLNCIRLTFLYLSVFFLKVDTEHRVMHYIATSLAYVNGIQVLWYPSPFVQEKAPPTYGALLDSKDYSVPFEDRHVVATEQADDIELSARDSGNHSKSSSSKEASYTSSVGRSQTINFVSYIQRLKDKSWWEICLLIFLLLALSGLTVGLGIQTNKIATISGPLSIFALLLLTSLVRDYREGSLSCYFIIDLRYKIFGETV